MIFSKNKTVKNAGWLIGGKVAQMLINLIVGVLTARYLGPSNKGLIDYAMSYTSFFAAFCTLGINSVIVKEFIDNKGDEGKILGTSIVLRAASSFLSALVIIGIVSVADAGETTTFVVVALSCIGMIFQIFEIFNYWFQSQLKSKVTAIVALLAYIISSVYKVVLLITGSGVELFAFATSVDYICIGAFMLFAYKKYNGSKFKIDLSYGKSILKKSCHFILPSLMVAIYGQTDKIMLKQMISTEEIAFYSTAMSVCSVWCFVLSAIIDSAYPSIMEANNKEQKLFNKRNKQLYAIVFYISVAVSLMLTIFAKPIIGIMYGEAYLPAVSPLKIVTWYTAFSYLGVARNAWIVGKNRQKYLIFIYAPSAIANIVLNLIFIPYFRATGAAIATLFTQIFTVFIVPFFIRDLRENSKMMVDAIFFKF